MTKAVSNPSSINKPACALFLFFSALLQLVGFAQTDTLEHPFNGKNALITKRYLIVQDTNKAWSDTVYSNYAELFYWTNEGPISEAEVEQLIHTCPERRDSILLEDMTYTAYDSSSIYSVVGPYLSYGSSWYFDGGAHPSYGRTMSTYNMETRKKASLLDVFDEEELLIQLKKDSLLQSYLTMEEPKDLDEFINNLDPGCDFWFGGMLSDFAFEAVQDDQVSIRIGVSHGCEVMRGNYAEMSIQLTIPGEMSNWLRIAEEKNLLMSDLK